MLGEHISAKHKEIWQYKIDKQVSTDWEEDGGVKGSTPEWCRPDSERNKLRRWWIQCLWANATPLYCWYLTLAVIKWLLMHIIAQDAISRSVRRYSLSYFGQPFWHVIVEGYRKKDKSFLISPPCQEDGCARSQGPQLFQLLLATLSPLPTCYQILCVPASLSRQLHLPSCLMVSGRPAST